VEREAAGEGFSLATLIEVRLGHRLEAGDRWRIERAAIRALGAAETGTRELWRNPRTGSADEVELARHMAVGDGRLCRILHHDQSIGAARIRGTVTACRHSRGGWRVSEVRWWRLGDDFAAANEIGPVAVGDGTASWRMIAE
jgi:surface antigen